MIGYEEVWDRSVPDEFSRLAVIVRREYVGPPGIKFFTEDREPQQLAAMRHPAGHVIPAHVHVQSERRWIGVQEVLIVREGRLRITFYTYAGHQVGVCLIGSGDVIHLMSGGHKIEVLEDVDMLEVKTGPYYGREKDKILLPIQSSE